MGKVIVVGCGLSGAVIARFIAEELNQEVEIYERRNHIGGNMYDYRNEEGILVHQYGPHTFHTKKKHLYEFMCKYADWDEYKLTCGAVMNETYTPTPFNFQTIDDFYNHEDAKTIKAAIHEAYPNQTTATVLELLEHENVLIREYAQFLFDNDYSLYTAKQWGIAPSEIDPSVLKRVPIRFNYEEGYFDDEYQVMPRTSYVDFFKNILAHTNITVHLNEDIKERLTLDNENARLLFDGAEYHDLIIFTGAIDELLDGKYGVLPYRSLRFEWKTEDKKSFQAAPVVAYPQAKDFTRITEYTKLPYQDVGEKTTYAIEYSLPHQLGMESEPYYPIPNKKNFALYKKYHELTKCFPNLHLCGRLAEYQYYNMDQALENALNLCAKLKATYIMEN